ncbi:hypothetical protein IMG5_053980 [Ichthyophthirius multifiliis]|uniref:Esterase n=1 Tax=Ichthyophthirius multifiliis TaxID=5932 RepID=G0QMZ2_ICHMU|nr:hypothetical protein IMG5_053980 [Ichthyophthirius multifiliis]EGR33406.1 hypothetical protein IMG5_053980 [Ichthyophthirius multifiliis]|eukprot:XP_004037392.1 hypothetical protein IMG5_053980 [Ichthyophthirius multifiliis]
MKKNLILYAHGFGGSGFSKKAEILQKHFPVLSLSLPFQPNLAIANLENTLKYIDSKYEVTLIGSSLGGYYQIYLTEKYNLKCVLINPSIQPYLTAAKFIGINFSYYDQSKFEWNQVHTQSLYQYEVQKINNEKNYMLFIQKGDEILDYKVALKKFPNAYLDIEEGGNHEYQNFEKKMDLIRKFIKI